MTKRVVVLSDCNACDLPTPDGVETQAVSFAIDGVGYSMDLCKQHHDKVRELLEPLRVKADVASAKKSTSSGGVGVGAANMTSAEREGLDPNDVREWARANGYTDVPDVGRIRQDIIAAYKTAHGMVGSSTS